jgi:thioredoxin-like negative regulator of GroEL
MDNPSAERVVRLNDSTFHDWAEKRPPLTLVLVGMAACAQARELEPVVAEAGARYAGRVQVAAVDMDESPEMVKRHKVDGSPTILLLRDGKPVARMAKCGVAAADIDKLINEADAKGR